MRHQKKSIQPSYLNAPEKPELLAELQAAPAAGGTVIN
jgi:hypothetical protein